MGTAVTVEHIRLLRNALPEAGTIVLCLDGDEPGQRAMERACREVRTLFSSYVEWASLFICGIG
jgi:DNA primase